MIGVHGFPQINLNKVLDKSYFLGKYIFMQKKCLIKTRISQTAASRLRNRPMDERFCLPPPP
jgi:hypothetical protein